MPLEPGIQLGPYEVLEPIGTGGMGEVYRARDTRLDRDVAIKVLPQHFVEDAASRARFEREAKAVAALSHPNILAIFDLGEHDGIAYAVMEYLEGQTLQAQLEQGPLPQRQALDYAAQMADGLASAHEKGIVHRDIKPSNLFVTTEGRLKILDFGLARTGVTPVNAEGETHTSLDAGKHETSPGTVLGTVPYMSPEQVRSSAVDHRSDVFSFGTVLLEMLTGERPFAGDSAVEIMHAILRDDPQSFTSSSGFLPPSVERIVRRCMEKEPARRFQSAGDLAFALRNTDGTSSQSLPAVEAAPPLPQARSWRAWALVVAALVVGGLVGLFVGGQWTATEIVEPVKVKLLTHSGRDWAPSASPDGSMIAFVSDRDGRDRIWLRQMRGGIERPLTEGPDLEPRFSPDGSSVLFLHLGEVRLAAYRVSVLGGSPRRVLDNVTEAAWAPDGQRIAYLRWSGTVADGKISLGIADVQTGEERELVQLTGRSLYGLHWSPDGRWLACASASAIQNTVDNSVVLFDVATGEMRTVVTKPNRLSCPNWLPDGRALVLAESTSLLGDLSGSLGRVLRLDPFSGDERMLFWVQSVWGGAHQHVRFEPIGQDGLVFDEILWRGNLTEFEIGASKELDGGRKFTQGHSRDRQPAYSPDGDTVVFSSNRSGNLDVWSLSTRTGELRQVTDDAADDWDPAFSADGRSVIWSSNRGGHLEIWTAEIDGGGARQVTRDGTDAENPTQTRDGQWIVYSSANPEHGGIWKIRTDGSEDSQVASGAFILPEVSPDGRYVLYKTTDVENTRHVLRVSDLESHESVFETHIEFNSLQTQIEPGRSRWSPDGNVIFFIGINDQGKHALFAQDFVLGADTSASRRVLLELDGTADVESFGISPDGTRVTVSSSEQSFSLKIATGIAGLND